MITAEKLNSLIAALAEAPHEPDNCPNCEFRRLVSSNDDVFGRLYNAAKASILIFGPTQAFFEAFLSGVQVGRGLEQSSKMEEMFGDPTTTEK